MLQQHYGINDAEYKTMCAAGITDAVLYKSVGLFDPNDHGCPLTKLSLFYYIDAKGDFNKPPKMIPHKIIARAMFNSLPASEKLEVLQYIDWIEEDDAKG